MANEKKVDLKMVDKGILRDTIKTALVETGFEVLAVESGVIFVRMENADMEIKIVAKKERIG